MASLLTPWLLYKCSAFTPFFSFVLIYHWQNLSIFKAALSKLEACIMIIVVFLSMFLDYSYRITSLNTKWHNFLRALPTGKTSKPMMKIPFLLWNQMPTSKKSVLITF